MSKVTGVKNFQLPIRFRGSRSVVSTEASIFNGHRSCLSQVHMVSQVQKSSERAFKLLKNDTQITEIGQGVLEVYVFKFCLWESSGGILKAKTFRKFNLKSTKNDVTDEQLSLSNYQYLLYLSNDIFSELETFFMA